MSGSRVRCIRSGFGSQRHYRHMGMCRDRGLLSLRRPFTDSVETIDI